MSEAVIVMAGVSFVVAVGYWIGSRRWREDDR